MPGIVSDHLVESPASLREALEFLATHAGEGWQPLAGGTDLLVGIEHRKESRTRWLNIWKLRKELAGIETVDGRVRVGGLATMTELRKSKLLGDACPLLGQAAATVGAVQIQNRATIAGNIVNASPAGDTLPVWLVLDAQVELASAAGVRRVPYSEFHTGYRETVRRDDELLTAVCFEPLAGDGLRILFRKIGTRAAQAISKVVLAAIARTGADGHYEDVRLAFGSMGPLPVRAQAAEAAALGKPPGEEAGAEAAAAISTDLTAIDDVRSTADYRMQVSRNIVGAFLAGKLGESHPRR